MIEHLHEVIQAILKLAALQGEYISNARKNPQRAQRLKREITQARDWADHKTKLLKIRLENTDPQPSEGFIRSLAASIITKWNICRETLSLWKAEPNPYHLEELRRTEKDLYEYTRKTRIIIEKL